VLSANDNLGAMMKGIQHGACDYFAKPARLEQLKTLWMHVVRNKMNDPINRISNSDDDGQKLQSRDGEAEHGANQNMMCWRKKRKDECGTKEDKENTSTSKRTRFEWSGALHRKFVEAVNRIGMDSKSLNLIYNSMDYNKHLLSLKCL
jgi:two-component response regulator ARR-B family